MDLTPTDEHRMLRESAARFASETYTAELRHRNSQEPHGFSRAIWRQFADLGWLGLPIEEAFGGIGGGSIEVGILMEALSPGLVSEPYLSTVVIGAGLVSAIATLEQKQALLPKVANGALLLAFAHAERAARGDHRRVDTIATRKDDGWRLNGVKTMVLDGGAADITLVSARLEDGTLRVFLVPRDQAGVTLQEFPRLGGGAACNMTLTDVALPADALLGDDTNALPAIEAVMDRALAAISAEAVGVMQALLDRTLDYVKVRKQFGKPLGANQVIRHRLVDMSVHTDEARSLAMRAAMKMDAVAIERSKAASGAKAKIGKGARFVGEQAIQLHGAMGVTEELDVGAYFKRLTAFESMFGSTSHHYRRHAELNAAARTNGAQ